MTLGTRWGRLLQKATPSRTERVWARDQTRVSFKGVEIPIQDRYYRYVLGSLACSALKVSNINIESGHENRGTLHISYSLSYSKANYRLLPT